jgi:hypothetical protein
LERFWVLRAFEMIIETFGGNIKVSFDFLMLQRRELKLQKRRKSSERD